MTHKPQGSRRPRQLKVKVLLADDHTMFREGIASMLSSSYGDKVEIVGKTTTGEDAVAMAQQKNPDILIMQVDEKLHKAKTTLKRIRRKSPSPPKVIVLTIFEDPLILREMMKLGASAYIHKSASVEELFTAVCTSTFGTEGEHVIIAMPQGALELSEDRGVEKDGSGDGLGSGLLSKRELEILVLTARGMSNRQIATALGICEGTVKRHLANIYPKMSVTSRGEAVRIALEREWFTLREIEKVIDDR